MPEGENECNKYAMVEKGRSPGVQACICADCGYTVGFNLLHEFESPRSVFEVLYTRFPRAPRVIYYDNGCNLEVYASMRAPTFFSGTTFLVDKFHFFSHHHCSPVFDVR